jgi:tRNA pseudouridine38-40 synthase
MPRRNFLVKLAYDGTDFQGWQRLPGPKSGPGPRSGKGQGGARSVQGEVERCLSKALSAGEAAPPIEVVGAGRTDAGVHAEGQAASFHAFTGMSCEGITEALNSAFPPDLACLSCVEVDARFHARLHASTKVYRYRILASDEPDPFLRRYSLLVHGKLDVEAMSAAAATLVGERDFRALSNAKGEDTERRLDEARVEASPHGKGSLVDLVFVGPGFIYNQVRVMAALLLEAGRGRISPERAAAILDGGDRSAAPGALGAFGLCLVDVRYGRIVENQKTADR